MKYIPLTQGKYALVDDEDYEVFIQWKWCYYQEGYAARKSDFIPRKTVLMHRKIMQAPTGMQVDHINGDKLDNRRANLRLCTSQQNTLNQPKRRMETSSQYKGVCRDKKTGRWRAMITVNGKQKSLGRFADEIDAAKAYDDAAIQHHGEFASINFP